MNITTVNLRNIASRATDYVIHPFANLLEYFYIIIIFLLLIFWFYVSAAGQETFINITSDKIVCNSKTNDYERSIVKLNTTYNLPCTDSISCENTVYSIPKYGCPYQVQDPYDPSLNKKYAENITNTIINKCSSNLEYIPIDVFVNSNKDEVKCENKECKVNVTTTCKRLDGLTNLSNYPKIIL